MKSKKEIVREYRDRRKPAGVYEIKNKANGKVFLGSSLDLDGPLNSHRFRLAAGLHPNQALQKDWNESGPDNFTFEILETVPAKEDPRFNPEDELTLLEEIWIEKLRPVGPLGYNTDLNLRRP
jgi:group I intron endonuclease